MVSTKITIIDPVGLHARPAALVVGVAGSFESELTLSYEGKSANLKSILNILALAVKPGATIEISANGSDENEALDKVLSTMKENKLI